MSRAVFRLLAGIFLALFLITGASGMFFWFKISALKKQIISNLENALGAQVQVSSLKIDVWRQELRFEGISLVNQRMEAPWEKGEISQATAHLKLMDLFSDTIPLKVEISSWNVILKPPSSADGQTSQNKSPTMGANETKASSSGGVRVMQISARAGQVEIDLANNKKVIIHEVVFEANENGDQVWTTDLKAGSVDAGALVTGPGSVQIHGNKEKVTFSNLHAQCDEGAIDGEGEISLSSDYLTKGSFKATNVPMAMLVAAQWQLKLSGFVTGDLVYEGNDRSATAHGHIDVSKGKCNVLPLLSKVTTLVNLPDISDVEFDKVTGDFNWKDHILDLANLDIRKKDMIRMAGEVQIDPLGQVDGKIKLGLPSTITSRWPTLQDKVFSVQFEDYNWTDVHLTGSADNLQEDLTPRLIAVGTEQGGNLLNDTAKKASDLLNGLLNK